MLPATLPQFDPKFLLRRLARLRRRLRIVTVLNGVLATLGALVGGLAFVGLIDYWTPLPPLVRALGLVWVLAVTGIVVLRKLIRPLRRPVDDFHLALSLE